MIKDPYPKRLDFIRYKIYIWYLLNRNYSQIRAFAFYLSLPENGVGIGIISSPLATKKAKGLVIQE